MSFSPQLHPVRVMLILYQFAFALRLVLQVKPVQTSAPTAERICHFPLPKFLTSFFYTEGENTLSDERLPSSAWALNVWAKFRSLVVLGNFESAKCCGHLTKFNCIGETKQELQNGSDGIIQMKRERQNRCDEVFFFLTRAIK